MKNKKCKICSLAIRGILKARIDQLYDLFKFRVSFENFSISFLSNES